MKYAKHISKLPGLIACLALVTSTGAYAQSASEGSIAEPAQASTTVSAPDVGTQSRTWLKNQANRSQASTHRQTLSGPVLKAVNDRYVKSFSAPIETTSFHDRMSVRDN